MRTIGRDQGRCTEAPNPPERMNSPLEIREVRLRGLPRGGIRPTCTGAEIRAGSAAPPGSLPVHVLPRRAPRLVEVYTLSHAVGEGG